MMTIVDYGLGNIRAFLNMYRRLNISAEAASSSDQLRAATRIILPGVGAFDDAMSRLAASGLRDVLEEMVIGRRVPVLGVCVGMQMLAEGSDEGQLPGLGWIPGRVRALSALEPESARPVPHMGWNDVRPRSAGLLFDGLESDARFYFLHSFYFDCQRSDDVLAVSSYGRDFACAVQAGHVSGVQFHPEKSHHFGARLLKNFADVKC
jgi:glutamine amidotransferase